MEPISIAILGVLGGGALIRWAEVTMAKSKRKSAFKEIEDTRTHDEKERDKALACPHYLSRDYEDRAIAAGIMSETDRETCDSEDCEYCKAHKRKVGRIKDAEFRHIAAEVEMKQEWAERELTRKRMEESKRYHQRERDNARIVADTIHSELRTLARQKYVRDQMQQQLLQIMERMEPGYRRNPALTPKVRFRSDHNSFEISTRDGRIRRIQERDW